MSSAYKPKKKKNFISAWMEKKREKWQAEDADVNERYRSAQAFKALSNAELYAKPDEILEAVDAVISANTINKEERKALVRQAISLLVKYGKPGEALQATRLTITRATTCLSDEQIDKAWCSKAVKTVEYLENELSMKGNKELEAKDEEGAE